MLKKKISLTGDSPNQDGGGKDYEITDTGNTNMKVVVRIRPENDMEIRSNCETVVKALDNHVLVFDPKEDNLPQFDNADVVRKRRPFLSRKRKDLRFAFDRVFDETTTQREVFENTTKTIIEGLLDGINCSVFAYGATGAGKTHTMLGTSDKPGVMFLTTMELYRCIEQLKHEKTCDIAVTYLEVYNETIRDLLVPSGPLAMREDSQKGLVVAGLSQHQPTSAEELLQMLEKGNMNRTQHPTDANATSSRSHAVFQVYVNQKSRTAGLSTEVTQGKMSLIDLAGSERATVTTNKGARLREGANINKSLLALGNCINALAANKDKTSHVPYRNSKLTRLLKDSLGGNCRTVMIANISPSGLSYDDTYNTLKYADRAKQIKTKLVRNIVNVDYHVTRYRTIVIELQKEITELKSKMTTPMYTPSWSYFDMSEVSRLHQTVSEVYSQRITLHKNMADLDAIERDTLLRIFRKEKDLQRIEFLTGNDIKISKIMVKLDYLRSRLVDVKEQKSLIHRQLSSNDEKINHIQSEVHTSNKDSSEAFTKYMETVIEGRRLETECSHQWKQTKHLLRYIKNQEKEISKTEKIFSLALELVRKQHQVLQATNCITPVVRDLFDSLVRQVEGDKEVGWNDNTHLQDSLCNISVSSFSQTHQDLFDNIVKYNSPIRPSSTAAHNSHRYSSPTIAASLGILTNSTLGFSKNTAVSHPLSNRKMATPPLSSNPLPPQKDSDTASSSSSNSPTHNSLTAHIKERKNVKKPPSSMSTITIPFAPPPRPQRSFSTSALTSQPKPKSPPITANTNGHRNGISTPPKGPIDLAQLTSISNITYMKTTNGFDDNFIDVSSRGSSGSRNNLPPTYSKTFYLTPKGQRLPAPSTTPQSNKPFHYPLPPHQSFSPYPNGHHPVPSPIRGKIPLNQCLTFNESPILPPPLPPPDILPELKSPFVSNPLYISHCPLPPPNLPAPRTPSGIPQPVMSSLSDETTASDMSIDANPMNVTYTKAKRPQNISKKENPHNGSGKHNTIASIFKSSREKKNKKQGGVGVASKAPLASQNTNEPVEKKQPPSYLALTKSAAIKRVYQQPSSTTIDNNYKVVQKENQPLSTRMTHSLKGRHKLQSNRMATTSRGLTVSNVA